MKKARLFSKGRLSSLQWLWLAHGFKCGSGRGWER